MKVNIDKLFVLTFSDVLLSIVYLCMLNLVRVLPLSIEVLSD